MNFILKYIPITGKIALFFVFVLFVNLVTVDIAYGTIQTWAVFAGLFSGFMFGRWAERMMIIDYFVKDAKNVEEIKKGLEC